MSAEVRLETALEAADRADDVGKPDGRLLGVDVARAVAQLGMLIAHYSYLDGTGGDLRVVTRFVGGKAMPLFVFLGGLGFTMLTRRAAHPVAQVVARSLVLFVLGLLLVEHAAYLAVILQFYALFFVLALLVRHLRVRWLLVLAGVVMVVGAWSWLHLARDRVRYGGWQGWATVTDPRPLGIDLAVSGSYPVLPTFAFFLVGMAVGRLALGRRSVQLRLAAGGLLLALVGLVGGELLTRATTDRTVLEEQRGSLTLQPSVEPAIVERLNTTATAIGQQVADTVERTGESRRRVLRAFARDHERATGSVPLARLADPVGHGKMPAWVIGATGWSMAVLGASLLVTSRWPRLLRPVAMAGQLALTFYVLQALGLRWWFAADWSDSYTYTGQLLACVVLFGGFVILATLWRHFLPRGPLEALLRSAGHAGAAVAGGLRRS
ncbi:MAG TPA: DUF418 domain-containing protein [Candidatus Limnocylindria bacterium]|nr:DUF418 domain-containing protein [Candidatus Limnocylindria bacterium]